MVVAAKESSPMPWVEVHCHGGREVIRLRFFEGWDFDELAARYSITAGSAKLKLARCMKRARELLRGLRTGRGV